MSERARSVLLGLAVAVGPLLLLDLAQRLRRSLFESGDGTVIWWMLACYAAVGAIAAFGVAASRRDRIVPGVALVVILLALLPTIPSPAVAWMNRLPLVGGQWLVEGGSVGVSAALAGAYLYALVRGPRA